SAPGNTATGFGRAAGLGPRFVLLAGASLALMVLDYREDHLARVRQGLSVVVYPAQVLVDLPFRGWSWLDRVLAERSELLRENERLKREQLQIAPRLLRL